MDDRIFAVAKKYGTKYGMISRDKKLDRRNRVGRTGVWYDERHGVYQVHICLRGKNEYVGTYHSLDDAIQAREEAEERLYAPVIEAIQAEMA